jgi:hypothetical protein
MDPMTIAALAGTVGGLFNKGPKMPKEIRNLYRFQSSIGNELRDYSHSVPFSDPQEQAALAQQHGLLGEQQMQQQQQLYGAYNPATDRGNLSDLMRNLTGQQIAQRSSLDSQHLMDALASRRSALLQASGVGQAALGPASQMPGTPGVDFSSLFSSLANSLAYKNARNPKTQSGSNGVNTPIIQPLPGVAEGTINNGSRYFDGPRLPAPGVVPLGGYGMQQRRSIESNF